MKRSWLLAMTGCLLLATCGPATVNEIVVGATANTHKCGTCLLSSRDNPPVNVTPILSSSKAPSGEDLAEYAERNPLGVAYKNVKLDLFVKGDDTKGAPSMSELRPLPALVGTWQTTPGQPAVAFPSQIRGIELGYTLSEARLVHEDGVGTATEVLAQPIMVELAPNVMLVPVQVIRVLPPDPSSSLGQSVAKFSKDVHKAYWDGRPALETTRVTQPGIPNHYIQHAFDPVTLGWRNADEIWAQCGIQFRMIDCPGSDLGCPDLRAEEDRQVAGQTCTSGFNADASKNWSAAADLRGVDRDLPIVVFMHRVTDSSCLIIDVAKSLRAAMGYTSVSSEFVLAHEMGHVLGLRDVHCENVDQGNLMCEEDGFQTEKIRPEDCANARSSAAIYVKRKWNQVVAP